MKIKRQGKEYNYDYKHLIIKSEYYTNLQKLAKKHDLPMGRMINKLVEEYESSIRK